MAGKTLSSLHPLSEKKKKKICAKVLCCMNFYKDPHFVIMFLHRNKASWRKKHSIRTCTSGFLHRPHLAAELREKTLAKCLLNKLKLKTVTQKKKKKKTPDTTQLQTTNSSTTADESRPLQRVDEDPRVSVRSLRSAGPRPSVTALLRSLNKPRPRLTSIRPPAGTVKQTDPPPPPPPRQSVQDFTAMKVVTGRLVEDETDEETESRAWWWCQLWRKFLWCF